MAQGSDGLTGLLADPHRVGAAEVGLDVERVLGTLAADAHGPASDGLEERVLHVLGDQAGDVLLTLRPLLGPPRPLRHRVLEDGDGFGGGAVAGLQVGEDESSCREDQRCVHPTDSASHTLTLAASTVRAWVGWRGRCLRSSSPTRATCPVPPRVVPTGCTWWLRAIPSPCRRSRASSPRSGARPAYRCSCCSGSTTRGPRPGASSSAWSGSPRTTSRAVPRVSRSASWTPISRSTSTPARSWPTGCPRCRGPSRERSTPAWTPDGRGVGC